MKRASDCGCHSVTQYWSGGLEVWLSVSLVVCRSVSLVGFRTWVPLPSITVSSQEKTKIGFAPFKPERPYIKDDRMQFAARSSMPVWFLVRVSFGTLQVELGLPPQFESFLISSFPLCSVLLNLDCTFSATSLPSVCLSSTTWLNVDVLPLALSPYRFGELWILFL